MVHFLQLFLLRAAGFLLPFYIMAWAISILQRHRQRQVSMPFPLNITVLFLITLVAILLRY
jgi:biotin transporter BioY